jgi:hypothetical protein
MNPKISNFQIMHYSLFRVETGGFNVPEYSRIILNALESSQN